MSQNLYQLIIRNNYNGLSLDLIRRFAIQLLTSLQYMRSHHIVHCDLKPQNILLKQFNKSGIKIIDFGSSCFQSEAIYTYIQSRYYRAPEITLGIHYDTNIDIWSAGCILAELYTGVPLFPGENQKEQIKYMVDTLGVPKRDILLRGERAGLFFNSEFKLKKEIHELKCIEHFSQSLEERIPHKQFRDFIQQFLCWNPKDRVKPLDALKNQWILEGLPQELRNHKNMLGKLEIQQHVKSKSQEKSTSNIVRLTQKNSEGKISKKYNMRPV